MVQPVTIRVVLTLAVTNGWPIQKIDVNNAFLNGLLEEEFYMEQPFSFLSNQPAQVCKPNKAIYGLNQAPRTWFERLAMTLVLFGFKTSKCDPSLLIHSRAGHTTYVLVNVDDIIVTCASSQRVIELIAKLKTEFALKQLGGLDYFLGVEIKRLSNGSLILSRTKYIKDLLTKANMVDAKGIPTPIVINCKMTKNGAN